MVVACKGFFRVFRKRVVCSYCLETGLGLVNLRFGLNADMVCLFERRIREGSPRMIDLCCNRHDVEFRIRSTGWNSIFRSRMVSRVSETLLWRISIHPGAPWRESLHAAGLILRRPALHNGRACSVSSDNAKAPSAAILGSSPCSFRPQPGSRGTFQRTFTALLHLLHGQSSCDISHPDLSLSFPTSSLLHPTSKVLCHLHLIPFPSIYQEPHRHLAASA